VPNAQDVVATPFASTCFACHDSELARAHMEQNGAAIWDLRQSIGSSNLETCAVCHGPGKMADIQVVHGLQ